MTQGIVARVEAAPAAAARPSARDWIAENWLWLGVAAVSYTHLTLPTILLV